MDQKEERASPVGVTYEMMEQLVKLSSLGLVKICTVGRISGHRITSRGCQKTVVLKSHHDEEEVLDIYTSLPFQLVPCQAGH